MSRFYRYQFTIRPARRTTRARITPRSCVDFTILLFREQRAEQRAYLVTSRLFSCLEKPFTNLHDFTKLIVRSDDGEAYRGCCIRYSLGLPNLSSSSSLSLNPFGGRVTMIDFESREAIRLNSPNSHWFIQLNGLLCYFHCESRL